MFGTLALSGSSAEARLPPSGSMSCTAANALMNRSGCDALSWGSLFGTVRGYTYCENAEMGVFVVQYTYTQSSSGAWTCSAYVLE